MKKLTKKLKENIEFNNGFITAIGLFLAHERDSWNIPNLDLSHLTLYTAADHLFDMEIPESLPINLRKRIIKNKELVFKHRLGRPKKEIINGIFMEFKEILREVDEFLWKKEVIIKYY